MNSTKFPMKMNNVPNILSFIRLPLALLFLSDSIAYRLIALLMAMLTDFFDGYLARRFKWQSRFGTILDPFTDKFFVLFALAILIQENRLAIWQAVTMLSRDMAIIIFGAYLLISNQWEKYRVQAIWAGKVMTTLQLFVLLGLTLKIYIPTFTYSLFMLIGVCSLIELSFRNVRTN